MSGITTWQPLPLPSAGGLPILLVSANFGTSAYTIHVTDMANVWTESLDRKAICMRGWNENTTIDPSDTSENMAKFLAYLKSALDASQPGHDQTSLGLAPASGNGVEDGGIVLTITCPIPGFEPLKWPMYLEKSSHSAVATNVVLPLIQAHHARKQEVESLMQALKHKDDVLVKLLDKLEATGTGLEHVFTALSGRKKVTREIAAGKVKGLAPFDQHKWWAGLADNREGPENVNGLIQDVFGGPGLSCPATVAADEAPGLDDWWSDFKGVKSQLVHRSPAKAQHKPQRTPSPPPLPKADDDDDDFQVQATPPHLMSSAKKRAANNGLLADDASTADEDEAPIPDSNLTVHPKKETETKSSSKLGTIGRKPAAPRSPRPKASPPKPAAVHIVDDDSETASEADEDATASLPPSSPPPPPPPPPKLAQKRGIIGRIGGGAAKASAAEKAKSPEPDLPTAGTLPKKIGVIGKKLADPPAATTAEEPATRSTARGRQPTREVDVKEEPRETSQERADRKREELKKELEKKAAAGPAKKKRRF